MWVTSSLSTALKPASVAIGNFDGVHRGHQQVVHASFLQAAAAPETKASSATANQVAGHQCYKTVVAFNPHPREFFTGQRQSLLTPLPEKVVQLEALGVEQLVLLPFDQPLAALTPAEFIETILFDGLQACQISVGFDFCFGHQRQGTAQILQAIAATAKVPVIIVPPELCRGERISSSAIRQALHQGQVQRANQLLGRSYSLVGQVVSGQQLGRTLGFPTANLQLPADKFLPRQGVYAVGIEGACLDHRYLGVMNLGSRPTVAGSEQTIEVHVLDWSGDLYGHTLTVYLEQFLRPEQRFASLDDLKAQIQADCRVAREALQPMV